jgi:secernin
MCDTMVALGNSTEDGSVLFAKNSDRQPNEPHIMIRVPARKHDLSSEKYVQATYIKVPQLEETYEVVLLKPSWIWGCEMGWNEHGLNIGNEAVFTRESKGEKSLIGMDFIRLALERCKTSREAVDVIIRLLEEHGQGGNCGFEKPFTYHNSFLLADRDSAWVLETAGRFWAAKEIKDVYSISNCLTIGNDFDMIHPDAVKNAVDKGWCSGEKDFSFAQCYSDKLFTKFSEAKRRREAAETALRKARGKINVDTMKSILRCHDGELEGRLFSKGSVRSVCMHAGGMIGDQTTGSYIASIGKNLGTYYVTGASAPCISVFKPLWMIGGIPVFEESMQDKAIEYWKTRERLHRLIISGAADYGQYIRERDELEARIDRLVGDALRDGAGEEELRTVMNRAFREEDEFVARQIGKYEGRPAKPRGSISFRRYWKKMNAKLMGQ